jgi:hypothetical protein
MNDTTVPPTDTVPPRVPAITEAVILTEWITCTVHNDGWVGPCGNDESTGGFAFVTADGVEVDEPNEASGWVRPLYACNECGRVGDQDMLVTNPDSTDEYDTHRVAVVRGPGKILFKD